MQWADLVSNIKTWLQNAGGVATLALVLWGIAYLSQRQVGQRPEGEGRSSLYWIVLVGTVAALFFDVLFFGSVFIQGTGAEQKIRADLKQVEVPVYTELQQLFLALAGACALATVSMPVLIAIFSRLAGRRIWAMARLSLKEAVRSRVVLVFGAMAIIFLFADWFVPFKPEDQVRNYVRVVYWSMAPLFILTAGLLGAFSIPNDVKSQAIHTIVTKPVEKFEIVLGRFLGYGVLLSVGMFVLTSVSLLYVLRGVHPEAAKESLKARVPIFSSDLWFWGTEKAGEKTRKGSSVGREWEYRSYIAGAHATQPNAPKQYAVWSFQELPGDYDPQTRPVRFEFTFDIFRLIKGEEAKGIYCTFTFADGRLSVPEIEERLRLHDQKANDLLLLVNQAVDARKAKAGADGKDIEGFRKQELKRAEEQLISEFGLYVAAGLEVTDYHTQSPGGDDEEARERIASRLAFLFKELEKRDAAKPRQPGEDGKTPPALSIFVNVDRTSPTQMLGVAKRDLYVLASERPFWINFLKGVVGMWFTTLLVLGVAVACSTYLSGVISWIATMFLFGAGLVSPYVQEIAEGRNVGGGPVESIQRIFERQPLGVPLEDTPTTSVLRAADDVYRWWLRQFLTIIPDVGRFDLHDYVANGFDISWIQVLLLDNLVPLLGYLLPLAVLAFYLMKYREIANPT